MNYGGVGGGGNYGAYPNNRGSMMGASRGGSAGGGGPSMQGASYSTRGTTHGMSLKQARGAVARMKNQMAAQNYAMSSYQQKYNAYGGAGNGGNAGFHNDYSEGNQGYSQYGQNQYEQYYGDNASNYSNYPGNYYSDKMRSNNPFGVDYNNWSYSGGAYGNQMNNANARNKMMAANRGGNRGVGVSRVGAARGGVKVGGKGRGRGAGSKGKGKKSGVGKQASAAGRGTVLKGREEEKAEGESPGAVSSNTEESEIKEVAQASSPVVDDDDVLHESWAEQIEEFVNTLESA